MSCNDIEVIYRNQLRVINDAVLTGAINLSARNINGYQPLHLAVHFNKLLLSQLLIDVGAPVNGKSSQGKTSLGIAIDLKNVLMIKLLISKNCKLTNLNQNHESAVKLVCIQYLKSLQSVTSEHEKDKSKLILNIILDKRNSLENPNLSSYYNLQAAIIKNEKNSIIDLINNIIPEDITDPYNTSYLEIAIMFNRLEVVELLLKKSINVDIFGNYSLESALIYAVLEKNLNIIRILIEYGADINIEHLFTINNLTIKCTLMQYTLLINDNDFSEALLLILLNNGVNVNGSISYENELFNTSLHIACDNGMLKCVKILLKYHASVNAKDLESCVPLHRAVGYPSIFEELIVKNSKVNAKSDLGVSPLHLCACYGNHSALKSMKLLIAAGAHVSSKNNAGQTPLMYAVNFNNNFNIIKCLINNNAEWSEKDWSGRTILHYVMENKNYNVIEFVCKYLIGLNVIDVNVRDCNRQTPIFFTKDLFSSSCHKFSLLLKLGADLNVRDDNNEFPKHLCVLANDNDVCPVQQFILCLMSINYNICNPNFNLNVDETLLYTDHEQELVKLNLVILSVIPKVTLLHLLYMKRYELSIYCNNINLRKLMMKHNNDFQKVYPHYGELLNTVIKRGKFRKELNSKGDFHLNCVLGYRIPELCSMLILKYVNNSTLKSYVTFKAETL